LPKGLQRRMRQAPRRHPRRAPCFWIASTVYLEQLGVKRHEGGRYGERKRL
jgi:hypothetical protein